MLKGLESNNFIEAILSSRCRVDVVSVSGAWISSPTCLPITTVVYRAPLGEEGGGGGCYKRRIQTLLKISVSVHLYLYLFLSLCRPVCLTVCCFSFLSLSLSLSVCLPPCVSASLSPSFPPPPPSLSLSLSLCFCLSISLRMCFFSPFFYMYLFHLLFSSTLHLFVYFLFSV